VEIAVPRPSVGCSHWRADRAARGVRRQMRGSPVVMRYQSGRWRMTAVVSAGSKGERLPRSRSSTSRSATMGPASVTLSVYAARVPSTTTRYRPARNAHWTPRCRRAGSTARDRPPRATHLALGLRGHRDARVQLMTEEIGGTLKRYWSIARARKPAGDRWRWSRAWAGRSSGSGSRGVSGPPRGRSRRAGRSWRRGPGCRCRRAAGVVEAADALAPSVRVGWCRLPGDTSSTWSRGVPRRSICHRDATSAGLTSAVGIGVRPGGAGQRERGLDGRREAARRWVPRRRSAAAACSCSMRTW
jgi:hypothetical protein